jgi:hypothetical protein
MHEYFRSLAIHQAKFHKVYLESLKNSSDFVLIERLMDGLLYDAIWLSKFPLLFSPTYGVARLSALEKAWKSGAGAAEVAASEILALRPLVDADVLRFVLALKPADGEIRVEIFFGGRAMNKPLWQYLAAWFEHDASLRSRLGEGPGMLETVFS